MPIALQIRDVPEDVRDAIAERAAQRGQSMQSYLLDLLRREASRARNAELFERVASQRSTIPDELDPDHIIREGRDSGFNVDREKTT